MKKLFCGIIVMMLILSSVFALPISTVKAEENGITTAMIQSICNQYGYKDRTTYWVYNESKDKAAHPNLPDDWYVGSTDSSYKTSNQIGSGKTLSYRVGSLYECAGFASFIGWKLTGSKPKTSNINSSSGLGSGWSAYSVSKILEMGGVKPGDIIRTSGHSAVVYSVNSNGTFTVAECWGGSANKISIGHGFNGNGSSTSLSSISGVQYVLRYGKTVQPLPEEPTISGATYPTTLSNGSSFGLRGTITCKYPMSEIRATVTNRVTKAVIFDVAVTPNATSYSIGNPTSETINSKLAFNSSSCYDSYLNYKVTVKYTKSGSTYSKVVLSKNFTVGTPAKPTISSVKFSASSVTVKKNVTITAVTSTNATKLNLYAEDGTLVKTWSSGYSDSGSSRTWKVTYAFSTKGKRTITFKAGNSAGLSAGKTASISVTAAPTKPTLSSVKFSASSVTVNKSVTITATTSTNATQLHMYSENGSLVKTWTSGYSDSGSTRTWKVTYAFSGKGSRTITFIAGNSVGLSGSKTASITVK